MTTLSDKYCITGYTPKCKYEFISHLRKIILKNWFQMIQLRSKHFSKNEYQYITESIIDHAHEHNIRIILNSDMIDKSLYGADGIHYTTNSITKSNINENKSLIIGASCHNLKELILLNNIPMDYFFICPVLQTRSHPNKKPLGWKKFCQLARKANSPVYALGGLNSTHLSIAKYNGAYGIAGIESFWDNQSI